MLSYDIVISAPMGEIPARLTVAKDGSAGEMAGKSGSGPVSDLVVTETTLSWSTKIERPMPMTLTFKGTRDGDRLSGKVRFGLFARGTFAGQLLPDAAPADG